MYEKLQVPRKASSRASTGHGGVVPGNHRLKWKKYYIDKFNLVTNPKNITAQAPYF